MDETENAQNPKWKWFLLLILPLNMMFSAYMQKVLKSDFDCAEKQRRGKRAVDGVVVAAPLISSFLLPQTAACLSECTRYLIM